MSDIHMIPKVDLHCHLDGSLSFDFLGEYSGISDIDVLRKSVQVDGSQCKSLVEYLEKFDVPIRCMQTPGSIQTAARTFVESLAADNIMYAEVRFSPMLLSTQDLSCRNVLDCVLRGLLEGESEYGIKTNVILCAMRHHDLVKNLEVFRLAKEYLDRGVCAVDLAGDEAKYPTREYRELFAFAVENGIPFTIHSGECGDADNIREAIMLGAKRIGHGIAMAHNTELQKLCADRNVGIEMCPISNFQTKAVPNEQDYPICEYLKNGLCVTVNTDNRTVSNTSIEKEFKMLQQLFGLTEIDFVQMTRNAVACSFADEKLKLEFQKRIDEYTASTQERACQSSQIKRLL